ncbi:Extracellular cystatin-like protease inhibitor [Phytophthora cinnamomi]|uniref:Extracellular cystatin-like protease inhibitor n=1 Tax=Phytophthora cinnamomi TaxID=4785 RepID=UPI0035598722|nr:Extracellular cystatin-like protease inhibitor [Phytophthora cinnamomi]
MASLRVSAALIAASSALLATVPAQTMVGTWKEATVTDADVNLLVQVAGNASYYVPSVTTAICLIAAEGLWTQTVAGTNYKYQVAGCAVNDATGLGSCVDRQCAKANYDIVIFSQPWTNTLQVTSVTPHTS